MSPPALPYVGTMSKSISTTVMKYLSLIAVNEFIHVLYSAPFKNISLKSRLPSHSNAEVKSLSIVTEGDNNISVSVV